MLHSRRVRRYQEFLKTLRRPEPRLCLCPLHLHPRPWVPPPCRTSRPHGEPSLVLSRRFHSNPELPAHSSHPTIMERRSLSQKDKAEHSQYLDRLHHEEELIKEAQKRVRNGEPLPKDVYNTVMKWSKITPKAEETSRRRGEKKGKKQQSSHTKQKKESNERDFEKEEEKLRQELRNVRELTQNNIQLLEENKRLMKKIQKLRQRAKRQGEAAKGSRDSVEITRDNDVILSLKKKYEDLLQYVLKVEAENQKLNSLIGASGEGRDFLNDTDTEVTQRTIRDLQKELQTLREQLREKDESLMKHEQELKAVNDSNVILQDTLKKHSTRDTKRPEVTVLEEEWIRRFNETRKMYEEAVQGYKDQLEQTQRKLVEDEQNHARQVEELQEHLEKAQRELKAKESNTMETKVVEDERKHGGEGEVQIPGKNSPKGLVNTAHESSPKNSRNTEHDTVIGAADHRNESEEKTESVTRTDKMYGDALELIVRRLEALQLGREDVEGMIGVIKDTISTCLQEWRDSFHQIREQQDEEKTQLQLENEELQRKLKGRNKKIETLQKQNQDQQRQNEILLHQSSLLQSQMASSQTAEQLGILSELPQKVQETEQHLADTKELLHKAQVENQTLQSQVKHLEEKLSKKDTKLKAEREHSISREREAAGTRESVSSLQHQLDEISREMNQLREQLSTKDIILEHTSAQLEERIRECASLSALAERYKLQQSQESDHIQTQVKERETASHKQLLELQAQASRYQAQLSSLRTEKENTEKSLRCAVRKLEEQVDQLNLRNSTLQRQLTTFTSTYHTLFSGIDLQPVTSPAIDTTALKGI